MHSITKIPAAKFGTSNITISIVIYVLCFKLIIWSKFEDFIMEFSLVFTIDNLANYCSTIIYFFNLFLLLI